MGNLSIRKLEDKTLQRLCIRTAHNQVSMAEEVRRILQAVMPPTRLSSLATVYFGTEDIELELLPREVYAPVSFEV